MGVVLYKEYIDFIIITYPYICTPFVLALFLQQQPYFFVHFKNVFSFLFILFLCNTAARCPNTFEIIQKSRSC